MGPTWGPTTSRWPQMGPMLAPWTLLSGTLWLQIAFNCIPLTCLYYHCTALRKLHYIVLISTVSIFHMNNIWRILILVKLTYHNKLLGNATTNDKIKIQVIWGNNICYCTMVLWTVPTSKRDHTKQDASFTLQQLCQWRKYVWHG